MHRRSLRNLCLILGAYAGQIFILLVALTVFYRPSEEHSGLQFQSTAFCMLLSMNSYVFTYWLPLVAMDSFLLLFVIVAGLRRSRLGPASQNTASTNMMWNALVYDSILYFTMTITLYTLNVVLWLRLPAPWIEVPANFAVAGTATFGCRLSLNLREVFYLPLMEDCEATTLPFQIFDPHRSTLSVQVSSISERLREGGVYTVEG